MNPTDKPTILLVDDQHSIRQILSAGLKAHGFAVLTAASAEKALALCDGYAGRIDILLTDLSLTPHELLDTGDASGDPHGIAVAQRALQVRPSVKVVLFTGHSDQHLTRLGLKTDGFLLLRKPCSLPILVKTCRQLLTSPVSTTSADPAPEPV